MNKICPTFHDEQGIAHLFALLFLGLLLVATLVILPGVLDKRGQDIRSRASKESDVVPDELLIRFRPQVDDETKGKIRAAHGLIKKQTIPQIRVEVVKVAPDVRQKVMETLTTDPSVESVELNPITRLAFAPNDPYFNDGKQWAPQKIQAPAAWDVSMGNNVKIAIIDSGVDAAHPDLAGKVVTGYNFYNNNSDTSDDCGHGTGVAGIAAAVTNNGIGIAGMAPSSMIMPIKAASQCSGNYSSMMSGIVYAADNGARVINISMGGPVDLTYLSDAVNYARSKGAIVVAPVGNDNSTIPFYPASYPATFAVAGTLQGDMRYLSSNYGSQVDIAAPATPIYTTWWSTTDGSIYTYAGGTSDAAPHVAGVAALLFAHNPNYIVDQVEQILRGSSDDLGDTGWDQYYGCGRINAYKALTYDGTRQCSPPAPIPTATPIPIPPTSTPSFAPTATPVTSSKKSGKPPTSTPPFPGDTIPPTVAIAYPANGAVFSKGSSLTIIADATDANGISAVDFLVNGKRTCTDTSYSYSCQWTPRQVGTYSLSAKAYDNGGNLATSNSVNVVVQ